MTRTLILTAACALGAVTLAAPAQAGVNQHQANQHHRIVQGIKSGELTRHEARHLIRQQASIARYEARSRADGPGLTRAERARIAYRQDRASAAIYRQKHDRQSR